MPAAIGCFLHCPSGVINIIRNHDAIFCAKVQIPEHVTGREGSHEEFFGVVPGFVAPKSWVRRAQNIGFVFNGHGMAALVLAVATGALAGISGPGYG